MILDKYIKFNQKVIISIISGMIWIYFRTMDCYKFLPRQQLFPTLFVGGWIFLNYYEYLLIF